jgi:DNA repair protein RecO (recombination protein O)
MRRVIRDQALCLRARPHRESSKLVTLFTRSAGRLVGVARGARRPKSRFGAALEPFALAEITWHWHQERTIYTISEAVLIRARPGITAEPARFLAAEQVGEFLLRTTRDHDPNEELWRLALVYLDAIETAGPGIPALVGSFLLKAASFLGFRPEVRNCLACGRPVPARGPGWRFDPGRGGAVCPDCGVGGNAPPVPVESLGELARLLYSPAAGLGCPPPSPELIGLVRAFLARHIDPLLLNSFNWREL